MTKGVDTAIKAVEPATLDPVRNASVAEAEFDQLRARNHPPLPPRKLSQGGLGVFRFHLAT